MTLDVWNEGGEGEGEPLEQETGERKAAGEREGGGRKGKQGKEAWGEVGSVIAHSMQVTPPTLMRLR